jgi:hypothetical protein
MVMPSTGDPVKALPLADRSRDWRTVSAEGMSLPEGRPVNTQRPEKSGLS